MTHLIVRAAAAAAGTALLLAGCASTPPTSPTPTQNTPSQTPTAVETSTPPTATETPSASPTGQTPSEPPPSAALSEHNASALVAIETAQAATEGVAFNLDWTRNRWEIELIAGSRIHEVYLSADGTSVTKQESERAEAEDLRLLERAEVPMGEAITTVVTATPDAIVVEADLDTRRSDVVWEVDTTVGNSRQRTLVNAVTGAVI
ncbi:MAG: PepSY domain-containing protein [Propionicimonas sp.]